MHRLLRELVAEINGLEDLDARALHRHYRAELADVPNCHLGSVLRAIIAYKIQERYYGVSLSEGDRRKLDALADNGSRPRSAETKIARFTKVRTIEKTANLL